MGYVTSNGLGDLSVRRRVVVGRRPTRGGYVTDAQLADLGWNPFKAVGKAVKKVAGVARRLVKPALIIGAATFIPGVGPIVGKVAGTALKLGAGAVKGGIKLGIGGAKALVHSKTAVSVVKAAAPALIAPAAAPPPLVVPTFMPEAPALAPAPVPFTSPPPLPVAALQQAAAMPAPVYEPRSVAASPVAIEASAPAPTSGELPGWVLPAAIGAGAFLLLNNRRR